MVIISVNLQGSMMSRGSLCRRRRAVAAGPLAAGPRPRGEHGTEEAVFVREPVEGGLPPASRPPAPPAAFAEARVPPADGAAPVPRPSTVCNTWPEKQTAISPLGRRGVPVLPTMHSPPRARCFFLIQTRAKLPFAPEKTFWKSRVRPWSSSNGRRDDTHGLGLFPRGFPSTNGFQSSMLE